MKRLFFLVMLIGIMTAARAFADPLGAGLGADRSRLSAEQIALRSDASRGHARAFRCCAFPRRCVAPGRIFKSDIWQHIESAAREYDLDPMMLAGMIFIESYGDPLAKSPTGPAGIAQMTRGSAKESGLSVRKVRIGSKTVKKTKWVGKGKNRRKVVQTVQEPIYRIVDERFTPARAISAMARRVSNRRAWLGGKVDFAIAEYHMGAGRMAGLLSAYLGRPIRVSEVTAEMERTGLTYAELFWTNTPYFRPEVYRALDQLNQVDYSPTYYFRVRQAMRLLEVYSKLTSGVRAPRVGVPGQVRMDGAAELAVELRDRAADRVAARAPAATGVLHQDVGERFALLPDIASAFGVRGATSAMTAERSTIGSALFVAHSSSVFRAIATPDSRSRACSNPHPAARDEPGRDAGDKDDACAPLHTLGWAFDVPSKTLSKTEQRDLKFILTDLRQAGLLAYVEEGKLPTYHVVRHPDYASRFEQFYRDAMAGSRPRAEPTCVALRGRNRQAGRVAN